MQIDLLIPEYREGNVPSCYLSIDGVPVRAGTKVCLTVEPNFTAKLEVSRLHTVEGIVRSLDEETAIFKCVGEVRLSGAFELVKDWEIQSESE